MRGDERSAIEELIEASSLGTPAAKALRARTPPQVVAGVRRRMAMKSVHWTPEEPDQPACDADVGAPEGTVMYGTLNPERVTCLACLWMLGDR